MLSAPGAQRTMLDGLLVFFFLNGLGLARGYLDEYV